NAAIFGPPGPALARSMSSSTEITGGEGVISFRLPFVVGPLLLGSIRRPGPDTAPHAWVGAEADAVPGGKLAAVALSYGHPTMKSRFGAAKGVRGEIPLLRGG